MGDSDSKEDRSHKINNKNRFRQFGEVPKMAEGTPLERVQVVNSGARVQIPPSPLGIVDGYAYAAKHLDK